MSKQSKKVTKRRRAERDVKKKKKIKKLGLSKFVPKTNDNKKAPTRKQTDRLHQETEDEERERLERLKAKEEISRSLRRQKENLSLVDRCRLQMSSSLLRLVDEKLYSSEARHAPLTRDEFVAYHEAYGKVCDKWPTKPIDFLVKFIKKRLLVKRALERWKFADIGCGREPQLKQKLGKRARVQSFDLVSTHEHVTEANMESLPLESNSLHCAVYSLSLMAKNLGPILVEAKRVLKLNGSLLIVEVTSRFEGRPKRFVQRLERIGFKKQSMSELKPNGFFTFFHFSKLDERLDYPTASVACIELKPCAYKSR